LGNYPSESISPPLASQANFWETGQGRDPSSQQGNYQKINSLMSKFTNLTHIFAEKGSWFMSQ
ncbi:MAG TPA: hypothetical protein VF043_06640, partial [Ktedonobacteraceae bacterium]